MPRLFPDPRKAQALAQFLAESTVDLTRTVADQGDRDLIAGIEAQEKQARSRAQEADQEWSKVLAAEPVTELQSALEGGAELRAQLQRELANTELTVADGADREKLATPADRTDVQRETSTARARVAELQRQIQRLDQRLAERERILAQRSVRHDRLEAERKSRQSELTAAEIRLREARANAGYRGERMKIIDPGVVPQRPSSPNVMLNVIAALLLGLVLPVLFLAIEMNYQEQRIAVRRGAFPSFVKSGDE